MSPDELRADGYNRLIDGPPPLDGPNVVMVADEFGWFWWKYVPASEEVNAHAVESTKEGN